MSGDGEKIGSISRFGPYQILTKVGAGGMATVHRARKVGIEGFERIVALKRLLPEVSARPEILKMFVNEATLASRLQHPNIAQVFELGEVDGDYFIAMEYVDGWSLAQVIRQARLRAGGTIPIDVTLSMLIQLCDAVAYTHSITDDQGQRIGLVHRDISPANLLVSRTGHIKLIDFGIARTRASDPFENGIIKGKFGYLAPEAFDGEGASESSDIFAIATVAHEMLTGARLFCSESDLETLERILYLDAPSPSSKNPDCPHDLDAVVLKALIRDPDARTPTCLELRDQLRAIQSRYGLNSTSIDVASWLAEAFSRYSPHAVGTGTKFKSVGERPRYNRHRNRADTEDEPTPLEHIPIGHYGAGLREIDEARRESGELATQLELELEPRKTRDIRRPQTTRSTKRLPSRRALVVRQLARIGALTAALVVAVVIYQRVIDDGSPEVNARAAAAGFDFVVEPAHARVRVGNAAPVEAGFVALEPGTYEISIESPGFHRWSATLELDSTGPERVVLELVPLGECREH